MRGLACGVRLMLEIFQRKKEIESKQQEHRVAKAPENNRAEVPFVTH